MTGVAGIFVPTYADETAAIDLSQKPIDTPTLDYLKENNILIPQKDKWDSRTKTWSEANPVESPGSTYTITAGTESEHTFDYITADKEGNLTHDYYKTSVSSPLDVGETGNIPAFGTSENIKWTKLESAPAEGTSNTISVKASASETLYYSYEYTMPKGYTKTSTKIDNTLSETNANKKLFQGINSIKNGGAICNDNSDKSNVNIIADFINNTLRYDGYVYGGAIYNSTSNLGNIKGDFIGNKISGTYVYGGAIYNTTNSTIGDITGDYIDNSARGSSGFGGAICNKDNSSLGNITGDYINNKATDYGGAIYNTNNSTIGNISGNFINNSSLDGGGAIYNGTNSTIGNINGYFINNSVTDNYRNGDGGAIHNYDHSTIGDITGYFINNSSAAYGAAIHNERNSVIHNITGDFIGNSRNMALSNANSSVIGNITGDFISNSDGAIYNVDSSIIGDITGNFINNSGAHAIFSQSKTIIGNITGDFIGNSGGAIANSFGTIRKIIGNFIGNSGYSGSAISNTSSSNIGGVTGDFFGNFATSSGGAVYNTTNAVINYITGDFISNSAKWGGGVIYNDRKGSIGNITGNFINNSVSGSNNGQGGAIYNHDNSIMRNIEGDFINNTVLSSDKGYGGAIYNGYSYIGDIAGDFIDNSVLASGEAQGGAIYNSGGSNIGDIAGNFINNSVTGNGVVNGGAIVNSGMIGKKDTDGKVIGGIINTNFIGNYAKTESGNANGGAIYTSKNLNIIVDDGISTFKDNYTQVGNEKDDNAIYVANVDSTLNFQLKNDGQIWMYDNIRGDVTTTTETAEDGGETTSITNAYSVNIQGDDINKTTFYMYNDMYNANLSFGNTTINTLTNNVHTYNVNSLTVTSDTNFIADIDLQKKEMDRFTANEYGEHTGNVNVIGMNILKDANPDEKVTAVYFAQPGLKNHVTNGVSGGTGDLPQKDYQTTVYTPIYKYNVTYDKDNQYDGKGDGGYFLFSRGDNSIPQGGGTSSTGNPSDAFNPAVLSTPISSVAAAQATINETFKYVFEHADAFTQMPYTQRMAQINSNKYAISTDFNGNRGSLCYDHNNKAAWFRPYATFETMNLKNGPKVDAITYGSLAGFDTDFHEHRNGWHSVGTGYIGYNGSQLSYKGVDTTMNGGVLGYTHTMYKGNFWTALTLSAGASVGESRTMYGKEDFTSLMAGVGSKTGYNFEFKEGKYILQPIMFMSYTFVNTFDYTNAAGVRINADPAHSIQLNPSIRFISNFKNGWQPYASVGMVWNVMNENNVTANNVRLPEMSMKPYVEYGVGVQRNWKDKFTAFGQAMLRNGGRNGIALTAGFRWALGKGVNDKVEAPKTDRTVLKQLTPQQKMALTGKKNTTITSAKAVLKQL